MPESIRLLPRNVVWYTHAFFSILFIIPKMLWFKRLRKRLPEPEFLARAHVVANRWMETHIKWSGVKVDLSGLENISDEPVVFVANHQSYFDVAVFLARIPKPKGFIAKIEMKKAPVISAFMDYIGCVYMDRADLKKSARAINAGVEKVRRGHSMIIFPEGTRSKSNEMGEWKAGSLKLATKAGVPIIPVTLFDSFKSLEANGYRFKPVTVTVIIGEPVRTDCLSADELTALPDRLKAIIQKNIDMLKSNIPKSKTEVEQNA